MIMQIKFTVSGKDSDDIRQQAEGTLMEFVGTDAVDRYRMAIEVHDTQADRSTSHHDDMPWMAHVTVRPKRKRMDDDDDFGW